MVATVDGRLPPGPRGHLLLGSIPEIRTDNAFLDVWRRYGDTVRLRGPLTLYLVAHPDGVKHVRQDNAANYPRPPAVRDRLPHPRRRRHRPLPVRDPPAPGVLGQPRGLRPGAVRPRARRPAPPDGLLPGLRRPRRCIGEGFAQLQLPLVVAMVSQRYHLSLLPARPAEVGVAVTLRPRVPMLMRVERVA